MVLELASLEKKKKEKKKKKENDDFRFFSKFVSSASIKLSGNQRTYLYSGGSGLSVDIHFVGKFSCPFSLTYCTVKTFQPPSSLHRDRYCDL